MAIRIMLLIGLLLHGASAAADDAAEIEALLRAFLATTDARATHAGFWADDLIYTSSSGARYGKDRILARFDDGSAAQRYTPSYGGEDLQVRVFGNLAVLTFRLTADENGERIGEYFNTGVFRRTPSGWKAFTWQATRIPPPDAGDGGS